MNDEAGSEPGGSWLHDTWAKFRSWPTWVQIIVVLVLLGAISAPFTYDGAEEEASTTTSAQGSSTTTEAPAATTTSPTSTTTTTEPARQPEVPPIEWLLFEDATTALDESDLMPVVVGLDAQEASPDDDWLVVGASDADRFGNVGVTVASPEQLSAGVQVDLLSDSVVLYATIRPNSRDLSVFAGLVDRDPLEATSQCAQGVLDAVDDDLVVACFAYTNRDRYAAENRNDEGESSAGLNCVRAFSTVGGAFDEPNVEDMSLFFLDDGCPAGEPDNTGIGIERVPLPPGAVPAVTDENGTGGPADGAARTFTVPDSTLTDLKGFYNAFMPVGAPWNGWPWCGLVPQGQSEDRVWVDPQRSGSGLLRVSLGAESDGEPFVIVARHGFCPG